MSSRQLELAPDTLEQWGLLQQVDGGYRFAVPLLREWVRRNRPVRKVEEELYNLDSLVKGLYLAAQGFYNVGKLEDAKDQLNRVLENNPKHMQARRLLGRVWLEQGNLTAAKTELETVYEFSQSMAKQDLISTLLALAKDRTDQDEQLKIYETLLKIDPEQIIARDGKKSIWRKRAESALSNHDFNSARQAYQEIDDYYGIEQVAIKQRKFEATELARMALSGELAEDWEGAIGNYEKLLAMSPSEQIWEQRLTSAQHQLELQQIYSGALDALDSGDKHKAQMLLAKVIASKPGYRKSSEYLLQATNDINVNDLIEQIKRVTTQNDDLQKALHTRWRSSVQIVLLAIATIFLIITISGIVGWRIGKAQYIIQEANTNEVFTLSTVVTEEQEKTITPSLPSSYTETPRYMTEGTVISVLEVRDKPLGLPFATIEPPQLIYGLRQTTNRKWIEIEMPDVAIGWIFNGEKVQWDSDLQLMPITTPSPVPTSFPTSVNGIGKFRDCYSSRFTNTPLRNIYRENVTAYYKTNEGGWFYVITSDGQRCWVLREDVNWGDNERELDFPPLFPE